MAPATIEMVRGPPSRSRARSSPCSTSPSGRVLQAPAVGEPQVDLTLHPLDGTGAGGDAQQEAVGVVGREPQRARLRVVAVPRVQRHPCRTDPGRAVVRAAHAAERDREVDHLAGQDRLVLAHRPRQVEALDLQPEPLHEESLPPPLSRRPRPAGGPGRVGAARCRRRPTADRPAAGRPGSPPAGGSRPAPRPPRARPPAPGRRPGRRPWPRRPRG